MLRLCLKTNRDRNKWNREIKRYEAESKRSRKLLLVGPNESGKSTIIRQLRYLFENGRDDIESKTKPCFQNYVPTSAIFETKFSLKYQENTINYHFFEGGNLLENRRVKWRLLFEADCFIFGKS